MVECNLKARLSGSIFTEHDREDVNTNTRLQTLEEIYNDLNNTNKTLNDRVQDLNDGYDTLISNVSDEINNKIAEMNAAYEQFKSDVDKVIVDDGQITDDKIKDLKVEYDNFKTNVDKTLTEIDEILNNKVEEFQNEYNNAKNNKNHIPYKSASVTVANTNLPTDETYRQLSEAGLSQTLCPMVNVTSTSAETFTLMDRDAVVNAITYAKSKGVPTDMIKPHIGVNWSDSTYRPGLNPTNYPTFLTNWKEVLLHYAQICNEQGIPWLCIGCEMDKLVQPKYEYLWNNLVSEIRTAYPNLKLTYATTTTDFMRAENATLNCVDAIGVNLYLQWSTKPYNSNMTYEDIMPSFFDSYAPISGGFRANDRINEVSFKYKKPIFITEIGVIPRVTGIQILKPDDYNIRNNENFNISKIVIEAFFNSLCKNNNLTGFSIWHVKEPFNFFKYDYNIGNSVATDMIKEYIERGDI